MTELKSEDVKQAIVQRLLEIAPNVSVYKEAKTNPEYPHFFVYQITLTDTEERKGYHILSYSMTVRYRVASDPSTDLKLEQDLDSMSLKLMQGFNIIEFGDSRIRCTDKSAEKVEGVLHFFCTLDVFVIDSPFEEFIKQNKLNLEVNTNGNQI